MLKTHLLLIGLLLCLSNISHAADNGYSITIASTEYDVNQPLVVGYEIPAGVGLSTVTIRITQEGSPATDYLMFLYPTRSVGKVKFEGIRTIGNYKARIVRESDNQVLAETKIFKTLYLPSAYALQVVASSFEPWQPINVNVTVPTYIPQDVYLGVYPKGAPNDQYLNYSFARSGLITFDALTTPGEYEIRLVDPFTDKNIKSLSVNVGFDLKRYSLRALRQVQVGTSIKVDFRSSRYLSETSFVGLYPAGADDNSYTGYAYIPHHAEKGSLSLPAAPTPGSYELRLVAQMGTGVTVLYRIPVQVSR